MNRRTLLLNGGRLGLAAPLLGVAPASQAAPAPKLARPSAVQRAWQNLEVGMFAHFGPATYQSGEADPIRTPLSQIDPTLLDTDQWARTALSFGARYVVFVAKHAEGFCSWQTDTTDYSIKNTPWRGGKGDILAEISASCRKYGLKLGAYVSPRDDTFGAATGGRCATPDAQARYDAIYRQQLTEVWSRYGPLCEIWFDGSTVTPVSDLLQKHQPDAAVFQGKDASVRWVGNEEGFAPYPCWNGLSVTDAATGTSTALDGDPDGGAWMPCETDTSTRRPFWFWHPQGETVLTRDELLSIYYRSVGRGSQLLLNIPPDRTGLMADADRAAVKAMGDEVLRRFSEPLVEVSGQGRALVAPLQAPRRVDTVILQEDIELGERVRAYRLEGRSEGRWRPIGGGSAIGQKRIEPVGPVVVDAVRLMVTQAAALPAIRRLAVFDTGVAPPTDWNAVSGVFSGDTAGQWKDGRYAIDLSDRIKAPGQYLLRFVPDTGAVSAVTANLTLSGVPKPEFVKPVRGRYDAVGLTLTALESSVKIDGAVSGAPSGVILLKRRF